MQNGILFGASNNNLQYGHSEAQTLYMLLVSVSPDVMRRHSSRYVGFQQGWECADPDHLVLALIARSVVLSTVHWMVDPMISIYIYKYCTYAQT